MTGMRVDIAKLSRSLEKTLTRTRAGVRRGLDISGREFVEVMRSTRLSGRPGLNTISGRTQRALRYEVVVSPKGHAATLNVGWKAPISDRIRIHEEGGTIRPNGNAGGSGQWLTIPLPGTARGRAARSYQNTFFFTSKADNLILAQRIGKKGIRPLFVLKKSVYIPARLGFRNTWAAFRQRLYANVTAEVAS